METDLNLKQLETALFIGKYHFKHGVFYRKGSDSVLMYDVDCLCDEPMYITNLKANHQFKQHYMDEYKYTAICYEQEEGKGVPYHYGWSREDLNDYLIGKLLLFQPRFYLDRTTQQYHMNLVVKKAIEVKHQDLLDTEFITVPTIDLTWENFERLLKKKKPIVLGLDQKLYGRFHYFICDGYIYRIKDFKSSDGMTLYLENQTLLRLPIANLDIIIENPTAFVPYHQWHRLLLDGEWESYEISFEKQIVDDKDFLEAFDDYLKSKGLYYEFEDIVNFHMSLKTMPLVILRGMMGSGRHSLVESYIKFSHSMMLSVDLNDEILGFLNPETHTFMTSPSGFVEYLLEAKTRPNQNYFVLVSHLSQARIYPHHQIPLFNERLKCENNYPNTVEIPSNVFFIAFEEDNTIHSQILDYAMVLQLHYVALNQREVVSITERTIESYCLKQVTEQTSLTTQEKSFLDELNQLLEKCGPMMGLSYRSIHYLMLYLNVMPKQDDFNARQKAFDLALCQLVLPKIRGPRALLEGLIYTQVASSGLEGLLNKYNKLSDFMYTRKAIMAKMKELDIYGYAR